MLEWLDDVIKTEPDGEDYYDSVSSDGCVIQSHQMIHNIENYVKAAEVKDYSGEYMEPESPPYFYVAGHWLGNNQRIHNGLTSPTIIATLTDENALELLEYLVSLKEKIVLP